MHESRREPTKSVSAAQNLPMTMPIIVTGEVKSSCSVRILRSSANIRMVSSGISTINAKIMYWK